jgi:serine/threonine protein kinase/Tol biopolymer transport system component
MNLTAGTRLGPYEILSPLGAGGMGEVYRARDPRLNREVAVKVLPASFASDGDRMRRFEHEAHATSALNHPNILSVYDIGSHEGSPFIVAELLDGEELRQQLQNGALPIRKAMDYAQQIASGLAGAHTKGIVHRDLKPENLFVTSDGRVKILDFGLAKLRPAKLAAGNGSEIATQKAITDPGVVLGTVGYMSPEQVRGQVADHRSDIFSFGVVLYEMLTGRRAFLRETAAEMMTAILKDEPEEVTEVNSKVPPQLVRIVQRCLEKKPERRFQTASDLCFALETLSMPSGSQAGMAAPVVPRRRIRESGWMIATVVLFLVSALLAIAYFRRTPAETPALATRFFISPPEKAYFGGTFAVSPDGRRLILRVYSEGKVLLWVRAFDSLMAHPLAGTEEAAYPFWSPDSRFIGFFSGGKLRKMEATGGPVQTLCDAPEPRGGTWNADGVILFAPKVADALYRVPAAGGTPVPVTTLDRSRKEDSHYHPQFLPDGRHFLYHAYNPQRENTGIYVGSLDSKETKLLLNTDVSAEYAPPGYLLFLRERTLMAQSFDADRLELRGEPFPVAERVDRLGVGVRYALFSVSQTGVLAYQSGSSSNTQLTWFDREGKQLGTVGPTAGYNVPWLSPDEKRVAVVRPEPRGENSDIWLIELSRGTLTRFTFDPAGDFNPVWSPDGSRIAFSSDRDGIMNLYQRAASGAGNDEALLKSDHTKIPNDWSADGRFILYQDLNPETNFDLWVLPLQGDQKPFPFLQTDAAERQGRFSPDGRWIAYASNESGTWQVYAQSFPASGGKWQISTNGGAQPQWRGDGKELFYLSPDRKLMAVDVKGDGRTLDAGVPKELFELRLQTVGLPGPRNFYVAAEDGKRFLVNSAAEERISTPMTVVLNWTADLKR